jgi:membrane dipeptidase
LTDHERNVPDDVLRACAATGGVVGINGIGLFLGSNEPTAADLFRHLDYVVQLIGAEHVGIALDTTFPRSADDDGGGANRDQNYWPAAKGYDGSLASLGPEVLPELVDLMREAGYPAAALEGILGGNFARVAAECWRAT